MAYLRKILIMGWILLAVPLQGQAPFARTGQLFQVDINTSDLSQCSVLAGSNTLNCVKTGSLPVKMGALGFRKTDNCLYGVGTTNNHIYRIGQNGQSTDLGDPGLNFSLYYRAGAVSADGNWFYLIGSDASNMDIQLAIVDLTSPALSATTVILTLGSQLTDIVQEPGTNIWWGFDKGKQALAKIDGNTGSAVFLTPFDPKNQLYSLFFDPFGDLYGYGSAVFGVVDGYFSIDKITGKEKLIATGPVTLTEDMAYCPFTVAMRMKANPEKILPCNQAFFTYDIFNNTEETMIDIDFKHTLPAGFYIQEIFGNPFGVPLDTVTQPGALLFNKFSLKPGLQNFSIRLLTKDLPKGNYRSQALLENLPSLYNNRVVSDNMTSAGWVDSTTVNINRFDKDSLFYEWFLCHGETMVIDASEYGNNIIWNTGSVAPSLPVTIGGTYALYTGNQCESIYVRHEVTSATCPYTIALDHLFQPDSIFACSDVKLVYLIKNDSGEPRYNISFYNPLPAGFSCKKVLKNPFGGKIPVGLPKDIIQIDSMTLPSGRDTLVILAHVDDLPAGRYRNRASLLNLPNIMGPFRVSDDPGTFAFDSTALYVRGAGADSIFLRDTICSHSVTVLDATGLGVSYIWDNGETGARRSVYEPGVYELIVQDGCEPASILFDVVKGPEIAVSLPERAQIHLGEALQLKPQIYNQTDTATLLWHDPWTNSLSCTTCLNPVASPLYNAQYTLIAGNGICADTARIAIAVDTATQIYAPNIFSPDDDGNNDRFFLQSPYEGHIKQLRIFDRWGNTVFNTAQSVFNAPETGWNGLTQNQDELAAGVYIWVAEIAFIDGRTIILSGDITLVR